MYPSFLHPLPPHRSAPASVLWNRASLQSSSRHALQKASKCFLQLRSALLRLGQYHENVYVRPLLSMGWFNLCCEICTLSRQTSCRFYPKTADLRARSLKKICAVLEFRRGECYNAMRRSLSLCNERKHNLEQRLFACCQLPILRC